MNNKRNIFSVANKYLVMNGGRIVLSSPTTHWELLFSDTFTDDDDVNILDHTPDINTESFTWGYGEINPVGSTATINNNRLLVYPVDNTWVDLVLNTEIYSKRSWKISFEIDALEGALRDVTLIKIRYSTVDDIISFSYDEENKYVYIMNTGNSQAVQIEPPESNAIGTYASIPVVLEHSSDTDYIDVTIGNLHKQCFLLDATDRYATTLRVQISSDIDSIVLDNVKIYKKSGEDIQPPLS